MTDYATLKIPREDFERHNARRKEMDITWTEYIDGQAPEPADIDLDVVRDIVREELASAEITVDSRQIAEAFRAELEAVAHG